MRIVGIDFGLARIGIAISDPLRLVATSFATVPALKGPQAILEALRDYRGEIERFVVGLPLELSGKEGAMATQARAFAGALEKLSGSPVCLWDERLTSAQVERSLKGAGLSRKRRAAKSDAAAASLILQSYLDAGAPLG